MWREKQVVRRGVEFVGSAAPSEMKKDFGVYMVMDWDAETAPLRNFVCAKNDQDDPRSWGQLRELPLLCRCVKISSPDIILRQKCTVRLLCRCVFAL